MHMVTVAVMGSKTIVATAFSVIGGSRDMKT